LNSKKILFIHFGSSSFVREDLKILKKSHEVYEFFFNVKKSKRCFITIGKYFLSFIRQVIWMLKQVPKPDLIYCWFADFHALIPTLYAKIFKIPLFVVIGGVDGVSNRTLNYGVFNSSWRAPISKIIIKEASYLLPVNDTLIEAKPIAQLWGEAYPNGIKHHVKKFNTDWIELPTGYDSKRWVMGSDNRTKSVLTVAIITSTKRLLIKGIDLLLDSSTYLTDYTFTIIGVSEIMQSYIRQNFNLGDNVILLPAIDREDLVSHYNTTSIYAQLSRSEGLPNVLCEAMLCGCIPVGSPVFGIPKAITIPELVVVKPKAELIANTINAAHEKFKNNRMQFRDHIQNHFSIEKREQKLLSLINGY